jgi:branched-chain amino acid transport system ATP-binding protein
VPVLELQDLSCGYGDIGVLHGLSMRVEAGEAIAVLGSNGAGKTTLARAISGILKPTRGALQLFGQDTARLASDQVARLGVAHVPEGRALFPGLTVLDNLIVGAFGSSRTQRDTSSGLEKVTTLFPWIRERLRHSAGALSGGQQQMVAIGRGLMADPKVLILDEPSLGLSPKVTAEVYEALKNIRANKITIILIEQNAPHALALADRGYVLSRGSIALEAPSQVLRDDHLRLHRAYLS